MSEIGIWERISNQKFSAILIVLIAFLLVLTVLAAFTNMLWAVGAALLYSIALPPIYYIEARAKHKFLTTFVVLFIFIFINNFIVIHFGQQWTPAPLFPLAIIEHVVALILVGSVVALLLERFLKPKLKSKPALKSLS